MYLLLGFRIEDELPAGTICNPARKGIDGRSDASRLLKAFHLPHDIPKGSMNIGRQRLQLPLERLIENGREHGGQLGGGFGLESIHGLELRLKRVEFGDDLCLVLQRRERQ